MQIKRVKTLTFIEELTLQNSKPMVFLCDDFSRYYCKGKLPEDIDHDFLVYELIGTELAGYFSIATPSIAFVEYDSDSLGEKYLTGNYNLESGNILFGSEHIGNFAQVDKLNEFIPSKGKDFNRLSNPLDLIKISVFDVHLNNIDRHSENYNLIFRTSDKKFFAIDHAAILGGPALKGKFQPKGNPVTGQKLIKSRLIKNLARHVPFRKFEEVVNVYYSMCGVELERKIDEVFQKISETWEVSSELNLRIKDYLLNETRNNLSVELLMNEFLWLCGKK